jgi:tetratricopeptide (TPR) repeat protein
MRLFAVAFVLALAGGPAHADDGRAARRHFEAGSTLYDLGKFAEAAAEYEEAYKAKSDPTLLFNIGQAYRGAKQYDKAITAYKSYLRRVPDARNRADVEGLIERAQAQRDAEAARQTPPPPTTITTTTTPPASVTATKTEKSARPWYKRWYVWTAVGAAVVVAGVAVGVAYAVPKDAPAPSSALTVSF